MPRCLRHRISRCSLAAVGVRRQNRVVGSVGIHAPKLSPLLVERLTRYPAAATVARSSSNENPQGSTKVGMNGIGRPDCSADRLDSRPFGRVAEHLVIPSVRMGYRLEATP